jgi:hypothetical protein
VSNPFRRVFSEEEIMAKAVVNRKIAVDLGLDRKLFPLLDVAAVRVQVTIEATTSSASASPPLPAPKAKMDKLESAARARLKDFETSITRNCAGFNKKIDDLLKEGKLNAETPVADQASQAIGNALHSAGNLVGKAVEDAGKKEFQSDKLLAGAVVKTVVKVEFGGVKLSGQVADLLASHEAHLKACTGLERVLYALGPELRQQLKDELKLHRDLDAAIAGYLASRKFAILKAAKEQGLKNMTQAPAFPQAIGLVAEAVLKAGPDVAKGRDRGQIVKVVWSAVLEELKGPVREAGTALQICRNQTLKMHQHADRVSAQGDKLSAGMKKAAGLKESPRISAECLQLKAKVTRLTKMLDDAAGFLAAAATTMEKYGLDRDDKTISAIILDPKTILSAGDGIVSQIESIHGLFRVAAGAA